MKNAQRAVQIHQTQQNMSEQDLTATTALCELLLSTQKASELKISRPTS